MAEDVQSKLNELLYADPVGSSEIHCDGYRPNQTAVFEDVDSYILLLCVSERRGCHAYSQSGPLCLRMWTVIYCCFVCQKDVVVMLIAKADRCV